MMKKLVVVAAIVCAAAFAEAGTAKWTGAYIDLPDSGTAYLLASDTVTYASVDDVLKSITAGTFSTTYADKASYSLDFSDGAFSQAGALSDVSGSITLWMIAVDDATKPTKAFVGTEITQSIGGTGSKTYAWKYEQNTSSWKAVPEPTSGLLLLLGMGALALRRRRA